MDKSGRMQFNRIKLLGEGGFARVYEVKDPRGSRLACKVVTKLSLKTKKAKTKLYAEIKIHRSLQHPNIVQFQDCFEDEENVYMTLELCTSGSLMDMLRRRRRFTEPEARFFMVQLIGACHYMHAHQVIHRDLKLGNLFLDANMNIKVGDFGLAALIENPGERKKTICGTPNYIAPEVLFDTANGHSFEVDTWSIGVILYTLVIGRPPFQTKDVKAIYKRIRDNEYEFPTDRIISSAVQHLISSILTPDPSQRPTLHDIVDHAFFTQGPVPAYIPTSANTIPPDYTHISKAQSDVNLRRLRKYSLLDVDFSVQAQRITTSASMPAGGSLSGSNLLGGLASSKSVTTSIAQQEKEFQKAVQPGSPISALLSSARQPLVMGAAGNGGAKESPLLRKLQAVSKTASAGGAGAVKESPLGRRTVTRGLDGIVEERDSKDLHTAAGAAHHTGAGAGATGSMRRRLAMMNVDDAITEQEEEEQRLRKKELEAQKARIVAQMAPVREDGDGEDERDQDADMDQDREEEDDDEGMPPPPPPPQKFAITGSLKNGKESLRLKERYGDLKADRENIAPAPSNVAPPVQRYASGSLRSGHHRNMGLGGVDKENMGLGGGYTATSGAPQSKLGSMFDAAPAPTAAPLGTSRHHRQDAAAVPSSSTNPSPQPKLNGFDAAAHTLTLAFDAFASRKLFKHPLLSEPGALQEEKVFIVSWVDYCNKYGMGYALTDGSVGVHFNDSTTVVLSPDKVHFDYITSRRQGTIFVRKSYTVSVYPDELKSKVYLLKHFERYIMDRLYGEYEYTFEDTKREKGMEWVQKYLRMKHVIVFKLSHDVLQFNFYDHSKLILSSQGLLITHIDKHYKMTRWTLRDVMALALSPPPGQDAEQARFVQKLIDKLKYCKEVLVSIKSAGGMAGEGAAAAGGAAGGLFYFLSSNLAYHASLRIVSHRTAPAYHQLFQSNQVKRRLQHLVIGPGVEVVLLCYVMDVLYGYVPQARPHAIYVFRFRSTLILVSLALCCVEL
ncbi:hypothetical protein CVT26_012074 [Gymnopilus dilepis]|uniref:Serine/threonine-protein kinase n=1 Tax=Gymnopilus dilepis TaxID=231916 RepID=A0A409WWW7_9AGAR|nr:hypothetical protein CVT26_012074 [Gymnopilus dilepis]